MSQLGPVLDGGVELGRAGRLRARRLEQRAHHQARQLDVGHVGLDPLPNPLHDGAVRLGRRRAHGLQQVGLDLGELRLDLRVALLLLRGEHARDQRRVAAREAGTLEQLGHGLLPALGLGLGHESERAELGLSIRLLRRLGRRDVAQALQHAQREPDRADALRLALDQVREGRAQVGGRQRLLAQRARDEAREVGADVRHVADLVLAKLEEVGEARLRLGGRQQLRAQQTAEKQRHLLSRLVRARVERFGYGEPEEQLLAQPRPLGGLDARRQLRHAGDQLLHVAAREKLVQ
eukprot:scaffold111694_cov66-Phaeocystis_antarctica.AAC.1